MRICVVTVAGHGVGGMQDHTRMLAKGLADAGHDVHVVTSRRPDGVTHEQLDGADWHYVNAGSQHRRLPRRDPAWLRRSTEEFARLHAERAFDVIHSESTSAIDFVRRGVHRNVPLVAKFHGSGLAHTKAIVRRFRSGGLHTKVKEMKGLVWLFGVWFQYGQLYRFRPCIWMVPSQQEFDETRRSHLLRHELGYVVPNGVDTDVFMPRSQDEARVSLGLDDTPLFVCAGRLYPGKGVHNVIQALDLLAQQGSRARLVVVGGGEARDSLEQLAVRLGLGADVIFTGTQPHDVLAAYLAAADAFVFPTELNEAFGLAPLQALACGAPVIASSVGSVPELLGREGECGLLVPPGDAGALASAMARILGDGDLRQRLRTNGLARVRADYTLERMIEHTVAVYEIARERAAGGRTS